MGGFAPDQALLQPKLDPRHIHNSMDRLAKPEPV
jgi:hypothetical protein